MAFTISTGHKMKIKESKKINKYLYVVRELKKNKLWNTKVTVISIVIDVLGRVSKDSEKELVEY